MVIFELKSTDHRTVTIDLCAVVSVEKDGLTFEINTSSSCCYQYFALDQYEPFMSAWIAARNGTRA